MLQSLIGAKLKDVAALVMMDDLLLRWVENFHVQGPAEMR